ncbi:MAG: DUF748 domain-containing protein [Spirochaetes bacterium]|nr:DUF748 domain-containing protein [Spirochaetota bacterium]
MYTSRDSESSASDTDKSQGETTFSIGRLFLQQGCSLIFIDETVNPLVRLDMQFQHFDLKGLGSKDENKPINFSSKVTLGPYASLTTEGFVETSTSPLDLDISLNMNSFELQTLSPYATKHLGYRFERGQMNFDGNLVIDEGQLTGKSTFIIKNARLIPEETEKSKEALKIYAKPLERAFRILSDNNNTLTIDIPISGDITNPQFDLQKIVQTAVIRAIQITIKVTLGIALWPYSGYFIAAD